MKDWKKEYWKMLDRLPPTSRKTTGQIVEKFMEKQIADAWILKHFIAEGKAGKSVMYGTMSGNFYSPKAAENLRKQGAIEALEEILRQEKNSKNGQWRLEVEQKLSSLKNDDL